MSPSLDSDAPRISLPGQANRRADRPLLPRSRGIAPPYRATTPGPTVYAYNSCRTAEPRCDTCNQVWLPQRALVGATANLFRVWMAAMSADSINSLVVWVVAPPRIPAAIARRCRHVLISEVFTVCANVHTKQYPDWHSGSLLPRAQAIARAS